MLTGTHSEAASYEFTTLTCIPGIIHYNDTKIQLLDLPGIIEGASEGKGRGRQVNTFYHIFFFFWETRKKYLLMFLCLQFHVVVSLLSLPCIGLWFLSMNFV